MGRAVAVDTFRGAERFRRVGFTAFFAADRGLAASGGRVTKEPAFSTSERDRELLLDAIDHGGDFYPVWDFGGEGQNDGFRQDFGVAFNGETLHVDDVLISESGQDLLFFVRDRDPWIIPFDMVDAMKVLGREHETGLPAISVTDRIAFC
jgi:hypothetical protein